MKNCFVYTFLILFGFCPVANALVSRQDVCDIMTKGQSNLRSEELEIYNKYKSWHKSTENSTHNSQQPYFFVYPNHKCPNVELAGRPYVAPKEPCRYNLSTEITENGTTYKDQIIIGGKLVRDENNNTVRVPQWCMGPFTKAGAADKAMIQEYGRIMWGNLFNGQYKITKEFWNKKMYDAPNLAVINYTINNGKTNGERVYGWVVTELSNTDFTPEKKAEIYCYHGFGSNWRQHPSKPEYYNCVGVKSEELCEDYNRFLSEIQKNSKDSTRIGVRAIWATTGTDANTGKEVKECLVDIP